jgi:epoxyqueuosine reductase
MNGRLKDNLRELAANSGACLVGFADIGIVPRDVRDGFPRAIAIAKSHDTRVIDAICDGPTAEYAEAYCRLNAEINKLTRDIADYLNGMGFSAKPLPATTERTIDEVNKERNSELLEKAMVVLPHKTIATLAGLGWIGRTDLLINEKYGPRIRLGSILTDAPFDCDAPVTESRCGQCIECVAACPVDAGRPGNWRRNGENDARYDVVSCDEFTRKISAERGFKHHLCGICIAACPIGK